MIRALAVLATVVCMIALTGCVKRDDTDPKDGSSGMELFTDAATGCQYLGFGLRANGKALTPRIAADGKTHMGCKGAKP